MQITRMSKPPLRSGFTTGVCGVSIQKVIYSIRQATEADLIEVTSLVKSLAYFYLDEPENELPAWLSQTLTENAFSERLSNGGYTNFVYEQNNKIIGYISLKKPNHL